jgi:hypothetical protein
MKTYLLFFALLLTNCYILSAQKNIPSQFQQKLNELKKQQQAYTAAQDRNNVPTCIADSILMYNYTSPTDSILEGYTVIEVSTDINGLSNTVYTLDPVTAIFYKNIDYLAEFDAQNREIFTEFVVYNPNSTVLFGAKNLIFYNTTTQKLDSTITIYLNANTNTWEKDQKTEYTYNANGLIFKSLVSNWTSNGWAFSQRTLNSYSTTNKISVQNVSNWNGSWMPAFKFNLYYLPNDSLSEVINLMQPNGDTLAKEVHTYGTLHKIEYFSYDATSMTYTFIGYSSFSKDAQNRNTYFEYNYSSNFGTFISNTHSYYGGSTMDCLSLDITRTSEDGVNFINTKSFYIYNTNSATNIPQKNIDWSIAPNPNDGVFNIYAPDGALVTICNAVGQSIWKEKIATTNTQINLQHFPAGIYLVSLQIGGNTEVKKVVVE